MKRVRPMPGYVHVRLEDTPGVTPGGIVIPDVAKPDRAQWGRVVAVSMGIPGKRGKPKPHEVRLGDRVYCKPLAGTDITVDGERIVAMRESEIYFIDDG